MQTIKTYKTTRGAKIAAAAFERNGKTAIVFKTHVRTPTGRLKKSRDGSKLTTPAVIITE
jgi:hypothetical protein